MQQLLGSGKTAVLVERIINKIIKEKIDIDNLLVVTFTNAAASEMRERILKAIYKILDGEENVDEQTTNHLQRQITLLNKANICTIDSFCINVIRNNFYEIDVSPNFRVADSAEVELEKQEVLEKIFEEKYENRDKDFEKLIKTYTSYKDDTPLKDLILKIYTYIESNPFPIKWLEEQVEKFNVSNSKQDFSETIWGKILLDDMKEELEDSIKKLKSAQKMLEVEKELEKWYQFLESNISQLETLYSNLDNWDKAYLLAQNIDFGTWPSSKKINLEEKDKAKKVREKVYKNFKDKRSQIFICKSEDANKDLLEMYEILSKLKNLIIDFDKEFKKDKKEKNILNFGDIEHFALEILLKEENGKIITTEVAKKYQEKFVEIAIDEYQDSNLVQEYILTSISKGNNIFMVGDVKQSIYKFRQARPDLFLKKYKQYKETNTTGNGIKIKLFKNFRSRKNILDFTNLIFENIMGEKIGEIDYTTEEYLNLGATFENSKENLLTEIDILDCKENQNEESEVEQQEENNDVEQEEKIEDIEIEAKYVAKKIRNMVDSKFEIYDKNGKMRPIKFKDIVILLRSTKGRANIFEKELRNQDIEVYSDTSAEYLESYEIQIIMDLLKIIDNPYQDIPLVHIMLSSIGMFTDDDLLEIRLAEQHEDFYTAMLKARLSVSQELREKIQIFLDKISSWREKNKYMDLDELIWLIYEETGFLNYVALMTNGDLRVANLKMLFERAKQYETASFKGLFNFINFIDRIKIGSGDLGSAKLIGENQNVVRIMSIHKSKGLEFPIVFLSGTGTSFNMRDLNEKILLHQDLGIGVKYINYDRQIQYNTLSKMALRKKIEEENLSEEMRVLYVALTRAKEKIYITSIYKDFQKNIQKMEELVNIYKKEDTKINPILIKKYKKYIEWILMVYLYNQEYSKEIMKLNVLNRKDILKEIKTEEKEEIDVFKLLEEKSKEISEEEILKLKSELEFEYKYKELQYIPTKESVTNIVNKNFEVSKYTYIQEEKDIKEIEEEQDEEETIEFSKPKFLIGTGEEKITSAQKGTLIHLCMKNLDFNKIYKLQDIKDLIQDLQDKKLITQKELEAINPNTILNFTKSKIYKQLMTAKEIHKEEPFYINIPVKEVSNIDLNENILVQGIIDLYYIDKDDKLVLLDYKTDFIREGEEKKIIERHKPQLMLYKRALESALDRKVDNVYIYSTGLSKEIEL